MTNKVHFPEIGLQDRLAPALRIYFRRSPRSIQEVGRDFSETGKMNRVQFPEFALHFHHINELV
ncbi:hypothetical protein LEP1GSC058_0155 [Leptospira fainei serovar Hurstbridge str. BUT 6]|uniref:Uncharacterized protein n=1 Tax=Leptospira fainei serovar Hurstbridge str. BUT 6 TaxID=1193011 RepID=S3V0S2_9LEPT|nr:hypothetical protein LEP1GSC058_0155 [Leptospira fainei serovar Hurstbridge str. BUT 6]